MYYYKMFWCNDNLLIIGMYTVYTIHNSGTKVINIYLNIEQNRF